MTRLVLIRHGEVHARWRGCCYGASDIGLSARGLAQSRRAAAAAAPLFAAKSPPQLFSSDLRRAQRLTALIEAQTGVHAIVSSALRERDFGDWEKRTWDEIYAETGDAMDGMVRAPASWRPPGGETTFEMRDRVMAFLTQALKPGSSGAVVVGHGGPIAAVRGTHGAAPVTGWPKLVPRHGEMVALDRPATSSSEPPGGSIC